MKSVNSLQLPTVYKCSGCSFASLVKHIGFACFFEKNKENLNLVPKVASEFLSDFLSLSLVGFLH